MNTNLKSEAAFLRDLDKPSLENLSYALRHPDTWPANFTWSFERYSTCAMGLAHQLWSSIVPPPLQDSTQCNLGSSIMAKVFAMPFEEAKNIFFGLGPKSGWVPTRTAGHLWWKKTLHINGAVTPEMVADQIDKYLAERCE